MYSQVRKTLSYPML